MGAHPRQPARRHLRPCHHGTRHHRRGHHHDLCFLAFVFGGQRTIGEFGVGLASAVLLDAFLLRTLLVSALMHLFGNANWWLPGWIERWLPHLSVEPADEATAPEVPDRPVHVVTS
jgi:MMPL family